MSDLERLLAKREIDVVTGCWKYTGALDSDGYGVFWRNGRQRRVHRVAYDLLVGDLPAELTIDHVVDRGCRYRSCFNPEHLEAVTSAVNVRRGGNTQKTHCPNGHPYNDEHTYHHNGKRSCRTCWLIPGAIVNAKKTHCPQGHEYSPENTYLQPSKTTLSGYGRVCRICRRERVRRAQAKRRLRGLT